MQVRHGLDGLKATAARAVLSVGNFDGVHRGHARLIRAARAIATSAGVPLALATFEPHPLTVLNPAAAPPRLTSPAMKADLLAAQGVDELIILPPTPDVLNTTAEGFWSILRDDIGITALLEGESFTFGKGRTGTIDRLREWAARDGIQLEIVDVEEAVLLDMSVVAVNSTLVRWLIGHGRARDAAILLGRPYVLRGNVVKGFQRGRTIGVPTANLQCDGQMIPLDGVYAGRCTIDGTTYPVALSIGTLPTFDGTGRQIEGHLIGFTGDLYDRTIDLEIVDWLRDQTKFNGVDALKAQLARDIAEVPRRVNDTPSRQIAQLAV
ncbi:MAG TPA: riboflavin biosynthesis protein RibF [Tepidisphaeraceae bacterium]|jgi:riboflavin kinase/FMN adenylyltransferase|nr:riboflavin biosynthesis protein RibF [Tepidisphaeraceae bacterium]